MVVGDGRGLHDTHEGVDGDGVVECAHSGHLERGHVEDVDTVQVTEELESLNTGSLLFTEGSVTYSRYPFPSSPLILIIRVRPPASAAPDPS